ncbi:unnamed protein product [Callosobruchus maculatus]|uniref:alpha-glucosidase n=1 Tax=Callosobruchus maculatus TaxID=64391 RepID=A0A653CTW0_CALMS|nr:unnamed protein product [Callosobruchus maculatus]
MRPQYLDVGRHGMKNKGQVILDFVPNHTSDQHPWFQLSANRVEGYEDYYIWADAKPTDAGVNLPPNNWLSVFKGSAWTFHPVRQQFYLHQFLKEQPDLNYRNDKVRQEMKNVLTYWLEVMDVDGVRIDAVPHLIEDDYLRNEPRSQSTDYKPTDYEYLVHTHTVNQDGSFDLVVMMTEAWTDIDNVIRYYGKDGRKGAHFSFNFWLEDLTKSNLNAAELERIVSTWMTKLSGLTPNWVLGNHDNHRIASKVGEEKADGLNMLTGFLPGVQVTYAGEEIGMEDGEVDCKDGDDFHEDCSLYKIMSRDFERTPFQWDNTTSAGFSTNPKTWLPVSSKKDKCNVKTELESERSHLKTYLNMQKLRNELGNLSNKVEIYKLGDGNKVLQIIRYIDSDVKEDELYAYHYFFNLNDKTDSFNFADNVELKKYIVLAASSNGKRDAGDIIDGSHLSLDAYESIILKTHRNAASSLAGNVFAFLALSSDCININWGILLGNFKLVLLSSVVISGNIIINSDQKLVFGPFLCGISYSNDELWQIKVLKNHVFKWQVCSFHSDLLILYINYPSCKND